MMPCSDCLCSGYGRLEVRGVWGPGKPSLARDHAVLSLNQGPLGLQVTYPDTHKGPNPWYK